MIVIAESGSTKTNWVLLEGQAVRTRLNTTGFNPNYFASEILAGSLSEVAAKIQSGTVSGVYFYGSGCSSSAAKNLVKREIRKHFSAASIEVEHDLFGAARALFGNGSGIACVLGTGSSSCQFENGKISAVVPSLGFLLADEGSGYHIGSLLLNAYFKNKLAKSLRQKFENTYPLTIENFISDLYTTRHPNSRIATYTRFVAENIHDRMMQELVKKAFRVFFDEIILNYPDFKKYDLGFTGSVAYLFQMQLTEIAGEYGLKIHRVIKDPIDRLVEFHMEGNR